MAGIFQRQNILEKFACSLILELSNKRIDFDTKKVTATVDDSYVKFNCQVLDHAVNNVTWEKDKRIINGKKWFWISVLELEGLIVEVCQKSSCGSCLSTVDNNVVSPKLVERTKGTAMN